MTVYFGPLVVMRRAERDRLVASRGASLGDVAWMRRRIDELSAEVEHWRGPARDRAFTFLSTASELRGDIRRLKGEVNDLTAHNKLLRERVVLAAMERGLRE